MFDVWFQVERRSREQLDMSGLETSWYTEGKEVTRFELSLVIGELDDEMMGKLDYDDRIFNAQTTTQMLEDYLNLLKLMAAGPEENFAKTSFASSAAAATSNLEL